MAIKKRIKVPAHTQSTMAAMFDGYEKQVPSTVTIDCSDKRFEAMLRRVMSEELGGDELVVRIGGYWPKRNFQAILRYRDRTRVWCGVVHADPYQAAVQTLEQACSPDPEAAKVEWLRRADAEARIAEAEYIKERDSAAIKDSARLLRKPVNSGERSVAGKVGKPIRRPLRKKP